MNDFVTFHEERQQFHEWYEEMWASNSDLMMQDGLWLIYLRGIIRGRIIESQSRLKKDIK